MQPVAERPVECHDSQMAAVVDHVFICTAVSAPARGADVVLHESGPREGSRWSIRLAFAK
jgi:hypothetical protein